MTAGTCIHRKALTEDCTECGRIENRKPAKKAATKPPKPVPARRTVNGLGIRKRLGRKDWGFPQEFGPDGWMYDALSPVARARIIVTAWTHEDGENWFHASISRTDRMPTYDDLVHLHQAVFQNGYAYQVFVPSDQHVNIHERCLHLWGKADGTPAFPPFDFGGTI